MSIRQFDTNNVVNPATRWLMVLPRIREKSNISDDILNQYFAETGAGKVNLRYKADCGLFSYSQYDLLCNFLDAVWKDKQGDKDIKIAISPKQLDTLLKTDEFYKSNAVENILRLYIGLQEIMPIIILRMTRGPTSSCVDFHCNDTEGSTAQIMLNTSSDYEGGELVVVGECSPRLIIPPYPQGALIQYSSSTLCGLTNLISGTRKSLCVVSAAPYDVRFVTDDFIEQFT